MKISESDAAAMVEMGVPSPIGELVVRAHENGVTAILFPEGDIDRWGRTDPRHTAAPAPNAPPGLMPESRTEAGAPAEAAATSAAPSAESAALAVAREAARSHAALAARQLGEYFSGERQL